MTRREKTKSRFLKDTTVGRPQSTTRFHTFREVISGDGSDKR